MTAGQDPVRQPPPSGRASLWMSFRWLIAIAIFAGALAVLFPLVIRAVLDLVAL